MDDAAAAAKDEDVDPEARMASAASVLPAAASLQTEARGGGGQARGAGYSGRDEIYQRQKDTSATTGGDV